jgi:hypothetical protein
MISDITTNIDILKQYKQIKKELANIVGVQEKNIQRCAVELINIAKVNDNILSEVTIYNYMVANPTSEIAKLVDPTWDESYTKTFLTKILNKIPFLIDSFNNIHEVKKND